jgi:hypothetical protein
MATLLRQFAAPLILAAVEAVLAVVVIAGIAEPATAQNGGWFPFFNGGQRRPFFQPQQQPQQQWQWWPQQQQPRREREREVVDFSKAPSPPRPRCPPCASP